MLSVLNPRHFLSSCLELSQSRLHSVRNRFEAGRQAEEPTGSGFVVGQKTSKGDSREGGPEICRDAWAFLSLGPFQVGSGGCESSRRGGEMVNIYRISQREA